jgi:hypothetical protein
MAGMAATAEAVRHPYVPRSRAEVEALLGRARAWSSRAGAGSRPGTRSTWTIRQRRGRPRPLQRVRLGRGRPEAVANVHGWVLLVGESILSSK